MNVGPGSHLCESRPSLGIVWSTLDADHDCGSESASSRNTARAKRRDSACRELDKTLRANVPKVSAVGTSPTSALPRDVLRSILPVGKGVSRKCFLLSFVSANSGSGFP